MLKDRVTLAAALLALVVGACSGCTAEEPSTDDLPSYNSLEETRQAVSERLNCQDDPPDSTVVFGDDGPIHTESVKCTQTVEVFYFDSQEARDDTYTLMSDAAESGGSVYFAEGRNWFVVDYSEVGLGNADPEPVDLSVLSEPLGTRFTEVK
jgi:hypothetical protein